MTIKLTTFIATVSLLSTTVASIQARQTDRPTCAVLTLDAREGITTSQAASLSDRFAVEFDRLGQYTIVTRRKMREVLEEQQFQASDSCAAASCAVEAGQMLGVRYMVYGTITRLGQLYSVNSFMIDVETGAQIRSATTDLRADIETLLTEGMRRNALALLGMPDPGTHDLARVPLSHRDFAGRTVDPAPPSGEQSYIFRLDNGQAIHFVYVRPGTFEMGANDANSDHYPKHEVSLDAGYWIATTPITHGVYRQVVESADGSSVEASLPVDRISWNDAIRFCALLQNQYAGQLVDGMVIRLPTEAEWEYACRAGATGRYYLDGDLRALDRHAWHRGNSGYRPQPVGQLAPNSWGLYDMLGNVSEWCLDWYDAYPGARQRNRFMGQTHKVLRGGDYTSSPHQISNAARTGVLPDAHEAGIGFRIVIGKPVD